jgi:hypothetical protein
MAAAILLVLAVVAAPPPPPLDVRPPDAPAAHPSGVAGATSPPPPPATVVHDVTPGVHFTVVPLLSYGSDIGTQLGGVFYLYDIDEQGERGDWAALGGTWTTHGPAGVELKGELLHLRGTSLRTFAQLKLALDPSAPYWGDGASLAGPGLPSPVAPGAGSPPPPYRYRSFGPWISWILRGTIAGPLDWWTRLRTTHVTVEDAPALLVASAPPGAGGGTSSLVHAGVVYDTRDRAASPRRGFLVDASGFVSPGPLSDFSMGGLDLGARAYATLWPGGVLAVRVLYDLKLGDVPFFERTLYEGIGYGEGLGGAGTIRGLARDRLAGEEKLLASAELRTSLVETRWFGRLQEWGLSAGLDAGRARDRGYAPVLGAGGFGGARVLLDRSIVLRFDVGWAGQGALGYYIAFDEAF